MNAIQYEWQHGFAVTVARASVVLSNRSWPRSSNTYEPGRRCSEPDEHCFTEPSQPLRYLHACHISAYMTRACCYGERSAAKGSQSYSLMQEEQCKMPQDIHHICDIKTSIWLFSCKIYSNSPAMLTATRKLYTSMHKRMDLHLDILEHKSLLDTITSSFGKASALLGQT